MSGSTPVSAADYGRSLRGLGFNLIVSDVVKSVHFATEVLGATQFFGTDTFAAMKLHGNDFMFHVNATYRGNELFATLESGATRGVGVELRCYSVDPDAAEARARAHGYTILGGSIDKPHGLRECMILDDDGYVWIPSAHLKPHAEI
jgi:uncharacterized glyoxalase superfamily protein PhnB